MKSEAGAVLCWLIFGLIANGQENVSACKNMSYGNRNQTDYGPLRVTAVLGSVKDAQGVAIPKACVGVFTEAGHKLIAATETEDDGHFMVRSVPPGDYRLVVRFQGFCPANAILRIERRSRGKKLLTVQMRPAGIDTCSFVELK